MSNRISLRSHLVAAHDEMDVDLEFINAEDAKDNAEIPPVDNSDQESSSAPVKDTTGGTVRSYINDAKRYLKSVLLDMKARFETPDENREQPSTYDNAKKAFAAIKAAENLLSSIKVSRMI